MSGREGAGDVMAAKRRAAVRPDKLPDFLDAAYDLEADEQSWLAAVMEGARAVWGQGGPSHGAIYDASDITAFRVLTGHFIGFSEQGTDCIMRGLRLITPDFVTRTFRSLVANTTREVGLPEMIPMLEETSAFGLVDAMDLNGLDPSGLGVFIGLWERDLREHGAAELALYRRMAHHIGAAHRCRRRLRESQKGRSALDATEGAEAIIDAKRRIVHAAGPAKAKTAREDILRTARARDRARTSKADANESLRGWRPLTRARWTLVDSFKHGGARYVVARENQACFPGLDSLSDRERQAVVYLAVGQSTKETAYALGISDVTVRVLLSRAAAKLGVRTRAELLAHDEVRLLRPGNTAP